MRIDELGLPHISGASDSMDSAFFAGMIATFEYPCEFKFENIVNYVPNNLAMRHPTEVPANNPLNFSRDQLVPLVSGLFHAGFVLKQQMLLRTAEERGWYAQNTQTDVVGSSKKFPDGPDWLSPSVRNHLRLCSGVRPSFIGKVNLILDILWAAYIDPKHEVNQLICMCRVAGSFYMRLLLKLHKTIDENIMDYWGGWRDEEEFGKFLINKIRQNE